MAGSGTGVMGHMLFFGFGFCAKALAPLLRAHGWQLSATCRDDEKYDLLEAQGITPLKLINEPIRPAQLAGVSHILLSAAPDENGDPALPLLKYALEELHEKPAWIGYLSTTGVYGDHQGAWVDEDTPPGPVGARGQRRVNAEAAWAALAVEHDLPLHYFRLAGIYGPGRNQLRSLKTAQRGALISRGRFFHAFMLMILRRFYWPQSIGRKPGALIPYAMMNRHRRKRWSPLLPPFWG